MTCDPKADYIKMDDKTGEITVKPAADAKAAKHECSILKKDAEGKKEIVKVQVEVEALAAPCTLDTSLFPLTMNVGETAAKSIFKADDSDFDMAKCTEKFEIVKS